ncbi:hypothetical protein YSY43_43530 [Paenibacillus sp. YSY-4.3]
MDLIYIQKKIDEIQRLRSQIMNEMDTGISSLEGNDPLELYHSNKFKRNFADIKDMRVACIMDEFTYHSFEPECLLMQVTPSNWKTELEEFKPHLFFLESAWRGLEGLWNTKIAHLSNEIIEIINYCRRNEIPVVFWNKEDPVHFETFIKTAKYADVVFTTDIDCIKAYKTRLKHNQVYLMPFAAQTKYHNPIELYSRANKFCFAGAYYKRYPERIKDLETFTQVIDEMNGLDIYDRNFYNNDENYAFPSSYKKYIVGHIKPHEIDKAYKQYRYNINMNSVKQSQSMCARRIFELLASNTVAVSNYSRAVRNFFGDLVICTDDGGLLKKEIKNFEDDNYYYKLRLAGLRKVLTEHTFRKRLAYLVDKIFINSQPEEPKTVAVIAKVKSKEELEQVLLSFNRQAYENKELIIFTESVDLKLNDNNIRVMSDKSVDEITRLKRSYDHWCFFSVNDYYGENYINDLQLAWEYTGVTVITKQSHYIFEDGKFTFMNNGGSYTTVGHPQIRKALINVRDVEIEDLKHWIESIDTEAITIPSFSIDEFNYCMNYSGLKCETVDDLIINDTGISMTDMYHIAEHIKPNARNLQNVTFDANEIYAKLNKPKNLKFKYVNGSIYVESRLKSKLEYAYLNELISLQGSNKSNKLNVFFDMETDSNSLTTEVAIILLDGEHNVISSSVLPGNKKVTIDSDKRAINLKLGFRFSGKGTCKIKKVIIGDIEVDSGCFLNKSQTLLITDNFPNYSDLYRSAFVYSRVKEYKNNGLLVDIFKYNNRYPTGFSEFMGHDIICGHSNELVDTLRYMECDTVMIHFLSEALWSGIRHIIKGKKVVIWLHGADIQPWFRRKHNFVTEEQITRAMKDSERKMNFWREIFSLASEESGYNLHFVFVSDYLAQEAFKDLDINLPKNKYSVIHNYIDSEIFQYHRKDKELRKKILSIRPYANNNYANDLTIKAILYLSKKSFFKDLEFRLIGKGELFKSTVKPVRKFKNVIIEEKFLRQDEIAELHKKYGIFLVPTRMDSQGVSRDEAMSSGLVPITNRVAAIPEFIDESCSMLVEPEDYIGLANSIETLYFNSELYEQLSQNAALRVRKQSGYITTITRELELINQK